MAGKLTGQNSQEILFQCMFSSVCFCGPVTFASLLLIYFNGCVLKLLRIASCPENSLEKQEQEQKYIKKDSEYFEYKCI